MRSILALMRVAWLTALSYRLGTLISVVGLLASIVPIYFISDAVQDVAQASIRLEGGQYFGFVVMGIAATYVLMAAVAAIPSALAGSIGSGTFESLLVTRTSVPWLLAGMAAYPLAQSMVRATLLLLGATLLGVGLEWSALPLAAVVLALMIVAYASLGLVAGALVLVFRTAGPLVTAVVAGSGLLGGVYYSTAVIPGWLQSLSDLVPLTYALRAIRRLLLGAAAWSDVVGDVSRLAGLTALTLLLGTLAFALALRHARNAGTLSQY